MYNKTLDKLYFLSARESHNLNNAVQQFAHQDIIRRYNERLQRINRCITYFTLKQYTPEVLCARPKNDYSQQTKTQEEIVPTNCSTINTEEAMTPRLRCAKHEDKTADTQSQGENVQDKLPSPHLSSRPSSLDLIGLGVEELSYRETERIYDSQHGGFRKE